jgi:hypothetical protein
MACFFMGDFPDSYPHVPPNCKWCTITHGNIRFNPNLYERTGKVCLSLLGTFSGDPWTPIHTLESIAYSIQGLVFVEMPLLNAPVPSSKFTTEQTTKYTEYVRYQAHAIGILEMLQAPPEPFLPFLPAWCSHLKRKWNTIIERLERLVATVPPEPITRVPFAAEFAYIPQYAIVLEKLRPLYETIVLPNADVYDSMRSVAPKSCPCTLSSSSTSSSNPAFLPTPVCDTSDEATGDDTIEEPIAKRARISATPLVDVPSLSHVHSTVQPSRDAVEEEYVFEYNTGDEFDDSGSDGDASSVQ